MTIRPVRVRRFVAVGAALALTSALGCQRDAAAGEGGDATATEVLAFVNARLIDGTGDPPLQNGVVRVRDGRIEAVGTSEVVTVPTGATVVDLQGRWLMPGLVNAHGHVSGGRDSATLHRRIHGVWIAGNRVR